MQFNFKLLYYWRYKQSTSQLSVSWNRGFNTIDNEVHYYARSSASSIYLQTLFSISVWLLAVSFEIYIRS